MTSHPPATLDVLLSPPCSPLRWWRDAWRDWHGGCAVATVTAAVAVVGAGCWWADAVGVRYRVKVGAYYLALLINSALSLPAAALRPGKVENMLIGAALMRPVGPLIGEEGGRGQITEKSRYFFRI